MKLIKGRFWTLILAFGVFFAAVTKVYADGEAVYAAENSVGGCKAAVVAEVSTGTVVYGENADEAFPIGTLCKIMTVLICAEAVDSGEISLDDTFTASRNAFESKGAVIWLETGDKMSVRDLLKGLIIGNANDAAVTLAEGISGSNEKFVERMNRRADELGMTTANFVNATGEDAAGQGCSARDAAIMSCELLRHEWIKEYLTTWRDFLRDGATELVNTNTLVRTLKGVSGVKAGYSDAAGYCLSVSAKRGNEEFVAVVLGCTEKETAFALGKQLIEDAFSGYTVIVPEIPSLENARVTGGTTAEVPLKIEGVKNIVIPNGTMGDVKYELKIPDTLAAPVKQGDKVGQIFFSRGDEPIYAANVIADGDSEKMTVGKALCRLLKNMLSF